MTSEQNPGVVQKDPIFVKPSGTKAGLFPKLSARAVKQRLARFARARRDLPERSPGRVTILAHQNQLIACRSRNDCDRRAVFDDVDAMRASVVVLDLIDANREHTAFENLARFDNARHSIHPRDLAERTGRAS